MLICTFLKTTTIYYLTLFQWVTFVMMVQAGTFMLPYRIWRALEGGLIEEFGTEAKTKIILEEEYGEDSFVLEALVEKYVKFFRAIWHRNNWYFFMFVLCELLNCVVLFMNFWLSDMFLNGKFYSYGWDVIQYTRHSVILIIKSNNTQSFIENSSNKYKEECI